MRWFSEFFVIFLGFQRKEEDDKNALSHCFPNHNPHDVP